MLKVYQQHDTGFCRSMVYAALLDGLTGQNLLPKLHDAVMRWIDDGCMTISGFEQDEVTRVCTAQSWYIQLVTAHAKPADDEPQHAGTCSS